MKFVKRILYLCSVICALCFVPQAASAAAWGIVDSLDLSRFIPIVLDSFMSVAMAGYEFFVGDGDGIIYLFVWGWLGMTIGLYLVKMYFPQNWLSFLGIKGGGQMWGDKASAKTISEDLVKPAIRAILAAGLFLQIQPQTVTKFAVDPFLKFGSIYVHSISESINQMNLSPGAEPVPCPDSILKKEYISPESCQFLVQPVADITRVNNQIIKRGMSFITSGLTGLMTLIPHGGRDILNLITGIFLVWAFVASNFFMALLIIQAIFEFGMALILYPFKVLMFVAKPKNPDKWLDPWNVFGEKGGIIESLKKLVVTMIACMFILVVNIAAVKALFNFNHSTFVVAAGGSASSNVPVVVNQAMGFGQHSVIWLSSLLTFFLMFKIFELTRGQLMVYVGEGSDDLYKKASGDAKNAWKKTNEWRKNIGKALGWVKKK
ncbi:MAG: hypothetical protein FWE50_02545 [Alphaproteobacteria bacterium]|nr:hypothetical protein [Alphaproteobacteria bacterium]